MQMNEGGWLLMRINIFCGFFLGSNQYMAGMVNGLCAYFKDGST